MHPRLSHLWHLSLMPSVHGWDLQSWELFEFYTLVFFFLTFAVDFLLYFCGIPSFIRVDFHIDP